MMGTEASGAADGRIPVTVLGATGSVGQRLVSLLEEHPWFRIVRLTASERSAGRAYGDAARWVLPSPVPRGVRGTIVDVTEAAGDVPLVFSALDSSVAGPVEEDFARAGAMVVSNAKNHRMDTVVPLLVPEVNPEHLDLLAAQDYGGGIVTNPNCSTIGLTLALAPLHRAFGVRKVHVVTLQAVSGAGLPGVSSLQLLDNVIPFISGEEEKIEIETRKILGSVRGSEVVYADITVSAQCTRVPVVDGHTLCVSVALDGDPSMNEVRAAWADFVAPPHTVGLPSAPERPVVYLEEPDAPQPRLHRLLGGGMACSVGRLRPCPLLGLKFVTVSHNTLRGAAGGTLLCAEMLVAQDRVAGVETPIRP